MAHSGTAASAAELAPAMTLIGLGMGATFSAIYDTAIGARLAIPLLPRHAQPAGPH